MVLNMGFKPDDGADNLRKSSCILVTCWNALGEDDEISSIDTRGVTLDAPSNMRTS